MKSRISIEIDFENGNQPILQIIQRQSDDVRDNLVQSFLQSLAHTSRWVKIEYKGYFSEAPTSPPLNEVHCAHKWHLTPITPKDLPEEIKLMKATIENK